MNAGGNADGTGFDVVVVGNGVLGLSLARVLARRGQRVAVLGRPHRPWAGSTAAGAMLGCFGEVTTSLLASEHGRAKLELGIQAGRMWPQWLAELEEETDGTAVKTAEGTTVILNTIGTAEIDDTNYQAIRAELTRHSEPFEDIEPADLDWVDADPISRPLKAFHIPGEHAVNSAALLERLESAVVQAGGTLIAEPAARVVHQGDRVTGVVLASGEKIGADHVMLAAGARTQELLDTLPVGPRIPRLVSGYGVSTLVRTVDATTPDSVIRTPNRSFACGLHVVPRSEGHVYLGATNVISVEPRDTAEMRDLVFLLQCAHRQVRRNLWNSDVTKVQAGNRPVSMDAFPLLGEGGMDGLWIMTGTYRDGLHLSPLLAQEFAARILGEQTRTDLEPFTPLRQPIQAWTREESVGIVVDHQIGIGYEQDWTIPVDWHHWIEMDLRPATLNWANEIDPEFTPPPELLFASRFDPELVSILRKYYATCREHS
ncbi:NAD(P)/FAD-dependent oxidoreductase [Streptomyces pinistramenti]|uniref:NAD(P)/FAD-dependent oxidoreductase n=1 Tax=Streptomyces pinistramenti TaxID=2884812 RepID=UPI001D06413D|nr:FAD-dependent oxidoreductase [Streptomyces pinistramenti]MCB5910457.1 FAD-dependent oxidoreductase [Streptomyces pinistramenti]